MEIQVVNLDNSAVGSLQLDEAVFGLEVRADILQRMVVYQLAKRQQGTHKSKTYGEVAGSTRKIYKQKGTGRARHGAIRAPQFRGGGKAFGPVVRSHAIELPKKVRALAMRHALSAKVKAGKLIVVDDLRLQDHKTKAAAAKLAGLGLANALIVGGAELDQNFVRATRNIPNVDVLPQQGANVYDILRRDTLVLSRAAVEALQSRLSAKNAEAAA